MNKFHRVSVAVSAFVLTAPAFAALDTAPITAAQTDMLTAAGAILSLAIAVWGAMKVVSMFNKR